MQLFWCFSQQPKGAGGNPTAPFQIAFLGQSLFLFSPVCGQSHSEASGPKVSWSVILILHCKQTDCILLRRTPGTGISSLSAVGKKYLFGNGRQSDCWILSPRETKHPRPADSKELYGCCHAMYYAKFCRTMKSCVRFLEQNWTEQSGTLGCGVGSSVRLWATVTDVLPRTPGVPDGIYLKGHDTESYSVIRGSSSPPYCSTILYL